MCRGVCGGWGDGLCVCAFFFFFCFFVFFLVGVGAMGARVNGKNKNTPKGDG